MSFIEDRFWKDTIKELKAIRKNMEIIAKSEIIQEKAERVKLGLSSLDEEFLDDCRNNKKDNDIIAIDFDGTLVENAWPEIGATIEPVVEYVKYRQRKGARLILWTNRRGERLDEAVAWCKRRGIVLSAVNENLPDVIEMFGGDCRKIFANEYLDACAFSPKQLMHSIIMDDKTWNARHDKPTIHGRWTIDDLSGLVYCSVCNSDAPLEVAHGKQFKSKYCPNCGTRMDKDDNK